MKTILSAAGAAVFAAAAAWGQAAAPLSFEVASVRPSLPAEWREPKAGVDRVDFPRVTLRYCLAFAYGVKEYQVSGPSWLGELRYDIIAKGPADTRHEQLPAMMQSLLAQRFRLQFHRETREFSVYVLSTGKNGPKLTASAPDPNGAPAGASFGMSSSTAGTGRIEAKNATMLSLANTLSRVLGQPVLDQTGIDGRYDLNLDYSREDAGGMRIALPPPGAQQVAPEPTVSLFASIQQFGLKLEARKVSLPAIVVDQAEKTPTEN